MMLTIVIKLQTLILPIMLTNCQHNGAQQLEEQELESIIIKHLETSHYQPTVRPPSTVKNSSLHQPVSVKLSIYIVTISAISVSNNDFTMDLLVRQEWTDRRLVINHTFYTLSIGYLKSRLWTPDLFFRNSKRAVTHEVTKPNHMIWLYPNGQLRFSQKLTVTLYCEMNLWNFPLDTQTCYMQVGSYGYPIEDLQFVWWKTATNPAIILKDPIYLNEFEQPKISEHYCQSYFEVTGNFSCLQANFILKRKFGFYLIYTYLPSIFIVSISWVAFFIDHRAVPARITLGLLALLALMTQSSSVVENLPRVSYVKAIDIWMFTCLAFVISSLFEFAVVNWLSRVQDKGRFRNELKQVVKNELMVMSSLMTKCNATDDATNDLSVPPTFPDDMLNNHAINNYLTENRTDNSNKGRRLKARQVDQWFSIGFPVVFIIFNIVYWFVFNTT